MNPNESDPSNLTLVGIIKSIPDAGSRVVAVRQDPPSTLDE